MDHLNKLFAEAAAERAAHLEKMVADYRERGDLVSAQNCEKKARELRA